MTVSGCPLREHVELRAANTTEGRKETRPRRLWLAVVSGLILAAGLVLRWLDVGGIAEHVLAGIALLIVAAPVARGAVKQFRRNPFNTEVLMITAAAGASAIGVFEEGAAVLILYNFAEAVEEYTVDKVRGTVRRMASLLPQRAMVKSSALVEIPVEDLKVGNIIIVKPGWRIPVDGRVVVGSSSVDQSAVTGESMPVEKGPGDAVLSGTLNLDGSLEVAVEKPFKDSTISRVIDLVMEAREKKATVERFIDRFSRFYTPSVIALAALVALAPPLALGQPVGVWAYRALIVLVIACPSALVISTPVTMFMGLTRAMRSLVLVKGGIYLEEISKIRAVAFDKTGTLTKGRLKVSKVISANGFREEEIIQLAALAEARSGHPIASAIINAAQISGADPNGCAQLTEAPGKGVKAYLDDGRIVLVGKPSFVAEESVELGEAALENNADSVGSQVAVAVDGRFGGLITVADEIRTEAKEAVRLLKTQRVKVAMLTGDNEATAKQVATELEIDEYYAELLPEDKVRIAKEMRQKYGALLMVGDGVNDAPVLAASNVGVAIGTAGNDVAIDVADAALLGSDLRTVPYLLRLGRKVMSKLRMNVGIALGLKFLLIALGALGFIPLWLGVIGDDGVTLIAIAYALPLLRFKL